MPPSMMSIFIRAFEWIFFGAIEKNTMYKRLLERESTNDELVLRAL